MTTVDNQIETNAFTGDCCTPAHTAEHAAGAEATADSGTPAAADATTVLEALQGQETPADVAAIRHAAFTQLLESGRPVTIDDLVTATDVSAERVAEIYASVRARGRVEFDDDGRLIGIAGLSLTPSRHELTIGNDTRWTWCALDAVGILGALGASGTVRSTDPQTGDTIQIEFVDGLPETDSHLFILGGYTDGNVREDWCPRVNFFTSRDAAESWVAANAVTGDIVSVTEITEDAAAMWRPVVDLDSPQVC